MTNRRREIGVDLRPGAIAMLVGARGSLDLVHAESDRRGETRGQTVDAAVKVGNLNAGPFGDSGSGVSPHLKWSGPGKYTLRASLGAGNLELKH